MAKRCVVLFNVVAFYHRRSGVDKYRAELCDAVCVRACVRSAVRATTEATSEDEPRVGFVHGVWRLNSSDKGGIDDE